MSNIKYVGMDVHKSITVIAVLNELGQFEVEGGTRPELARVSVARKLASIVLTVWQRREEFDVKKAFAQD